MSSNPYSRFVSTQLILRDQLAIDRTFLANERTFLSYLRTALAFGLTGAGCLRFSEYLPVHILGIVMIVLGIALTVVGVKRTMRVRKSIASVCQDQHTDDIVSSSDTPPPDGPV